MEDVLVVAIVFGSLLALAKMLLEYNRNKFKVKTTATSEPSMTTSELKALLTDAVEDVVDRRFDRLEERLSKRLETDDRRRLMPAVESGPDDVELEHPAPPLVARDRDTIR